MSSHMIAFCGVSEAIRPLIVFASRSFLSRGTIIRLFMHRFLLDV